MGSKNRKAMTFKNEDPYTATQTFSAQKPSDSFLMRLCESLLLPPLHDSKCSSYFLCE